VSAVLLMFDVLSVMYVFLRFFKSELLHPFVCFCLSWCLIVLCTNFAMHKIVKFCGSLFCFLPLKITVGQAAVGQTMKTWMKAVVLFVGFGLRSSWPGIRAIFFLGVWRTLASQSSIHCYKGLKGSY